MQFADFEKNCTFLSPMDPLFNAILRLRVWIGDMDELTFKLATLKKLRTMAFYKRLKPALVEEIEIGMLGKTTPLSFWALCEAHGLSVRVVHDRLYYDCGTPTVMWRRGQLLRMGHGDLFELNPLKPLYALSHYSLADLKQMTELLRLDHGKKAIMYHEIQKYLNNVLNH